MVKNPLTSAGDRRDGGSVPGLGRSRGEGNGNPLQYSRLENPMDKGAWWATVHSITKSGTQLSMWATHSVWERRELCREFQSLQRVPFENSD